MSKRITMSGQTRANWLINAAVLTGAIFSLVSGVYFLYFPSGGFNGGRNATYGVNILFSRTTWDMMHAWGSILMIAAIIIHLAIHWRWVKMMARRMMKGLRGQGTGLSKGGKINVVIDLAIAISFIVAAVTGMYFLFLTDGGFQGGRNPGYDPGFLFSRVTWDLIHSWSGIVMAVAAIAHVWIHWLWITKVTVRFFLSLAPQKRAEQGLSSLEA
ncbi:MAG: DUF4405 domain-containing protein [Anaerolineales bacterium]|nr:DUF4405 domain-containing protein [Anaerolineales bacterium]